MLKVLKGGRPERPENPMFTDGLWDMIQCCLEEDPRRRPEITEVTCYLRRVLAVRQDRVLSWQSHKHSKSSPGSVPAPGRTCSIESETSGHSLDHIKVGELDAPVGVRTLSRPRGLLRRVVFWFLNCGAQDHPDNSLGKQGTTNPGEHFRI